MLGNDLLGFHLRYHCANFLDTVERHVEAKVEYEHAEITRGGKTTMVRPFPISIDFDWHDETGAIAVEVEIEMDLWRERIGTMPEFLGLGIDRIDYTKGIPERLQALDLSSWRTIRSIVAASPSSRSACRAACRSETTGN